MAKTAVGLALMRWDYRFNRKKSSQGGKNLAKIGLLLFGVFFELIVGLSDFSSAHFVWPLPIIGIGLWVLVQNLRPSWK